LATEQNTQSILDNVTAGLDHFDPFQGFIDDDKALNLRYGFRIGNLNFLVNQFSMCEVVKKPVIYSIPNTPSWIQGLINLRGILVPVFNIKKHLGQETEDNNKNETLIVLDKGERAFATFIETLPDSMNLDDADFSQTSIPDDISETLKRHVIEANEFKEEIWLEINYDALIKEMTKDYSDYKDDE